jgi:hypothetical protein
MDELTDDVMVIAADTTLLRKFGKQNLDKVLSATAVQKAESVIASAADEFYQECQTEITKLKNDIDQLKSANQATEPALQKVVATAFAIKTKSGQAGYALVASLAKSLHVLCEEMLPVAPSPSQIKVIEWHKNSIDHLLNAKIKGDGGDIGKAIMSEITKLGTKT